MVMNNDQLQLAEETLIALPARRTFFKISSVLTVYCIDLSVFLMRMRECRGVTLLTAHPRVRRLAPSEVNPGGRAAIQ